MTAQSDMIFLMSDDFAEYSIPLPPSHGWRCKPGNELFIADRGAVAFEIPKGWVVKYDSKQGLTIHDQAPPADQARLAMTIFRLPPVQGGWSQIPLDQMMIAVEKDRSKKKKHRKQFKLQIHVEHRPEVELVWAEKGTWPDPENGKPIFCRQIMARARLVQVLITFDVYQEVAGKFQAAWEDLLRSIQVAVPRDITGQIGN
jgi:hypothetical protein